MVNYEIFYTFDKIEIYINSVENSDPSLLKGKKESQYILTNFHQKNSQHCYIQLKTDQQYINK